MITTGLLKAINFCIIFSLLCFITGIITEFIMIHKPSIINLILEADLILLKYRRIKTMKKYYATFKGINHSDIAEFDTKRDRDNWVNFKDPFSISVGNTPEDCIYERMALDDPRIINKVIKNRNIHTVQDEFVPGAKWYLRSVA